jgi:hypothetical protein
MACCCVLFCIRGMTFRDEEDFGRVRFSNFYLNQLRALLAPCLVRGPDRVEHVRRFGSL